MTTDSNQEQSADTHDRGHSSIEEVDLADKKPMEEPSTDLPDHDKEHGGGRQDPDSQAAVVAELERLKKVEGG